MMIYIHVRLNDSNCYSEVWALYTLFLGLCKFWKIVYRHLGLLPHYCNEWRYTYDLGAFITPSTLATPGHHTMPWKRVLHVGFPFFSMLDWWDACRNVVLLSVVPFSLHRAHQTLFGHHTMLPRCVQRGATHTFHIIVCVCPMWSLIVIATWI
jgi:hypothetical protein